MIVFFYLYKCIYRNPITIMLKKQSKVLKQPSKKAAKKIAKLSPNKKQLPDHHFKQVKVKRGLDGMGLFACEDIKKGELIIEYIGTIISTKEANELVDNQYLFEVNRLKTIDGSPTWNIARYCNHACGDAANAESDIKKGRVFVKAIKDIQEGEEIVYDYGEEFVLEHIAPYGCKCKATQHSVVTA